MVLSTQLNTMQNLSRGARNSTKNLPVLLIVLCGLFLLNALAYSCQNLPTKVSEAKSESISRAITSTSLLKVHYLDVGQADCILIQVPNGKNILIDAGNNNDAKEIIDYLLRQNISRLDDVIATHPHKDHIGAMDDVINHFEIGKIIMPEVSPITNTFNDVITAIRRKNLEITYAKSGMQIDFSTTVTAEIIAPASAKYKNLNDYSVVLHLYYGATSFLFMGDAQEKSEKEILKSGYNIKADVLKVGHHGSKTSTSASFFQKVSPSYAIISVGENNQYKHPATETWKTLNKIGVKVLRTDIYGTILIESDGKELTVYTKAKENEEEITVYITDKGECYHREGCEYLNRSKHSISLKKAKIKYRPCSKCNPPK